MLVVIRSLWRAAHRSQCMIEVIHCGTCDDGALKYYGMAIAFDLGILVASVTHGIGLW